MRALVFVAMLALGACAPERAPAPTAAITPVSTDAPAGAYTLDPSHASLIVRVDHVGFSMFTARFARFDAALELDPAQPENAKLTVSVDPASIEADNPPPGFLDIMRGPEFLDAAQFPQLTFTSTSVALTGANTATVTGDLTLHGVTRPLALDVTFNGGYAGHPLEPNARIGFSARGSIKRSDFAMNYGLPPAGSKMGVSDAVEIIIEAEFTGPPWAGAPQ